MNNSVPQDFIKLISDLERRLSNLELVSVRDPLTGALNRRGFEEAWRREKSRCERDECSLALAFLDLDHFKALNDTYGHEKGDHALISFVDTISAVTRSVDVLGRHGGEEFLLLMPSVTILEAEGMLFRIAERMKKCNIHSITFSGGLILVGVDESMADAIARADKAMYEAKNSGRDKVVIA